MDHDDTAMPTAADVLRGMLNRMHETFVQHGVPGHADSDVFPPTTPVIRYEDGTEVYGPLARQRAAQHESPSPEFRAAMASNGNPVVYEDDEVVLWGPAQ